MRAIILGGGYAKRMGQLGVALPKSLLPIAGRRAIEYTLDKLNEIDPEKILLTLPRISGSSRSSNRTSPPSL